MTFKIMLEEGVTTIHDETDGEQNTPPNPDATTDDNGNDIAVASLPGDFAGRLKELLGLPEEDNLTDDAIGAALSGYDGSNDGQDVFTVSTNGSTVNNLALTDANGDPLNGLESGLYTVDGVEVFLYTDNDNIVLGRKGTAGSGEDSDTANPDGEIVFAIYLDENTGLTAGKLWTVQFEAIAHYDAGDGTDPQGSFDEPLDLKDMLFVTASRDLEFKLTDAPSGQNLFIMFGDGDISNGNDEVGIIATGKNPLDQSANPGTTITAGDTVNTSQGGGITTFGINNQMIDEGEGIYFTFVEGPESNYTVPNLDQNEADIEANIQFDNFLGAKGAEFQVVQLQGGRTATIKISAYSETEDPFNDSDEGEFFVDGLALDDVAAITSVQVFESDGVTPAAGVIIIPNEGEDGEFDGTFTIKGVEAGDIIQYLTDGDHNRILIEHAGTGKGKASADFDIGGFKLVQAEAKTAEIGSTIYWEDDGPDAMVANATADTLLLDESDEPDPAEDPVVNDGIDDGIRTATADFADNFTPETGIDYGTDGAGSTGYSLALSADGIGSGLYALDATDTVDDEATDPDGIGQGAEIVLSQNATTGVITGSVGETDYFTISINATTGVVTFSQTQNVWHGNTGNDDDTSTLMLDEGEYLRVVQTVTDGDGDTDDAFIDVGTDVFSIEDDGPDAVVANATPDTLVLDESDEPDPAEDSVVNDGIDDGIRTATADFADNFTPETGIDYGTDGAGSTGYSLALSADGIGSGLYALDATDTVDDEATDPDGIGQGAEIVLSQNATTGVITGSVGETDYFTISINATTGVVTFSQTQNVWHGNTGNDDDTSTLMLDEGEYLRVVQTVTDADGDTDDAFIDVGTDVFSIEDDGPGVDFGNLVGTVTTTTQTGTWSETVGTDGFGAVTIAAAGNQFDMATAGGIESTGTIAFDNATGMGTLTADFDNDPDNGDESVEFTLTVIDDGTYDFTLAEVPLPSVTLSTDEGQLPAGGPDPVQTLTFGGEDPTSFVFFAVDADTATLDEGFGPTDIILAIGGEPDLTEAQLEEGAAAPLGNGTYGFIRQEIEMNVSTSGIGVNNNVLQGADNPGDAPGTINAFGSGAFDESFVINPEPLASSIKVFISKTAGGFAPPGSGATPAKTDYLYYNVYDESGNSVGPTLVEFGDVTDEGSLWSFTIDIDDLELGGNSIDAVQFTMGFGDIKIPKIEVVVRGNEPPNDIFLDFEATLTDADGDSATNAFEVDLYAYDVISDTQMFDYTLADAGTDSDAFNVNLASELTKYLITGFDNTTDDDKLLLVGDPDATFTINNDGIDSIVTVTETGGQETTVTVANADLSDTDIVLGDNSDADLLLLRDLENSENFATIDFHHGYGAFNGGRMDADFGPSDFVVVDAKDALEDIASTDTLII